MTTFCIVFGREQRARVRAMMKQVEDMIEKNPKSCEDDDDEEEEEEDDEDDDDDTDDDDD
jgi:hypothetical protein